MPVFCVRHNQRRRDNGDQRSDRFRPRYDVPGECAAGRAFSGHDDEVSLHSFMNLLQYYKPLFILSLVIFFVGLLLFLSRVNKNQPIFGQVSKFINRLPNGTYSLTLNLNKSLQTGRHFSE